MSKANEMTHSGGWKGEAADLRFTNLLGTSFTTRNDSTGIHLITATLP